MITKVVNINLHQPIYERLTAKQGDVASRYLLFHLLDGDKPFDLTGRSVRVYAIKPDKTEIFNDLVINDKTKGYCTLELTSQCLASAGIVKMELYISESDKVLTSIPFELKVINSINTTDSIVSTNEFTALTNGLTSLTEYDNYKNEISEARKGYRTVGERLDNFDSQLDDITKRFEKPKRSKIGVSALWSAQQWDTPLETMKKQVDIWVENEVEEISYIINVQYINNEFSIFGNQDNALQALQYAEEKGIKVVCLKVHGGEEDDILTYGLDNFKAKWKDILNSIHSKFKVLPNLKYFVIFNEREFMLDDNANYETFIIECLNQMKALGYKVGISSTNTYYSCVKINDNIKSNVDCFFVNQYPSLSFSGVDATVKQCKSVWNSRFLIGALENLAQHKKPIIMSETGTKDYYEYLANPSNYTWDDLNLNASIEGEVGILYLGSLLQSDYIKYITSTWLWFSDTFMKQDVKKYIDLYKRGVING